MKPNTLLIFSTLFFLFDSFSAFSKDPKEKPNVVFIFIDDLRPDLGCYGNEVVRSPNLDKLAKESALFTKQYVTVPTCGASRYSLLRGKLPQTKAELGNGLAEVLSSPEAVKSEEPETFIEQLRRNGYYTVGIGKISHSVDGYIYPYNASKKSNRRELPNSWDEMLFNSGKWRHGWDAFFAYADGESRTTKKGEVFPYEAGLVDDTGYPDGLTAELAVDKIKELSKKDKPFFLGVGFFKPHLPFNAPKKYWDLYDENTLSLSPSPDIPSNVNLASLHGSGEFNQYKLGEKASLNQSLSDEYSRKLIHGYYASISYIDAQVGKVISSLKESGLYENTLIVVWGDHGWHLGDQRVWGKHTLFERSLQSVLIMKSPDNDKGKKIEQVVSSVDIAPTILDFCMVPQIKDTDGESMKNLFMHKGDKKWRNTAYSYYREGISVATPRYRFTRYFRNQEPVVELYDHKNDPYEKINIAADKPNMVEKMDQILEKGNTGLYNPKTIK
jgi:arylsulfatase A-like enzyme